ncbi:MAG TPA: TlpA disulfide reductase family protein [Candidatus Sulfopaludibacter sp.]|jgi:peroxiredoxin|nr:TlpA disulfide reductase family protein [Candidatus Sulfopaludibacter sp.]
MKSRISTAGAALAVVLAGFTFWITARAKSLEEDFDARSQAITVTGHPAAALSLPALDGHTVSLADYHGKRVLIAWWASWCTPCKAEMPALNRLYGNGQHTPGEFEILAISVDEDRAAAESFARETDMKYPVLLDPGKKTVDAFHVESLPSLVLVDAEGQISYGHAGFDQRSVFELAGKLGVQGYRMGGMDGRRGN